LADGNVCEDLGSPTISRRIFSLSGLLRAYVREQKLEDPGWHNCLWGVAWCQSERRVSRAYASSAMLGSRVCTLTKIWIGSEAGLYI